MENNIEFKRDNLFGYFDISSQYPYYSYPSDPGESSTFFIETALGFVSDSSGDTWLQRGQTLDKFTTDEIEFWQKMYPGLSIVDITVENITKQCFAFIRNNIILYVYSLSDTGLGIAHKYDSHFGIAFMPLKPTAEEIEGAFMRMPIKKISSFLSWEKFRYPDKREFFFRLNLFVRKNFYELYPEFIDEVNKFLKPFNADYDPTNIVSFPPSAPLAYDLAINQDNRGSQQGNGFNLGKSEAYLKALYKALVDAEFFAPSTKESHFVNAFNGKPLATNFEPLAWADKSKTRNQLNTQTLYEFLYLLNFDKTIYQTDATNSDNFYRKIQRVFQPIANLSVKNPTKVTQQTPRHKELKTIIDNLN